MSRWSDSPLSLLARMTRVAKSEYPTVVWCSAVTATGDVQL